MTLNAQCVVENKTNFIIYCTSASLYNTHAYETFLEFFYTATTVGPKRFDDTRFHGVYIPRPWACP